MKKTKTLFALALMALATPALAQAIEDVEHKTITIGAASASVTPNQWYAIFSLGNKSSNGYTEGYIWDYCYYNAPEYYEESGSGPLYLTFGEESLYDGMLGTDAMDCVLQFIPTGETVSYPELVDNSMGIPSEYETYYMQFGTGNYIYVPDGQSAQMYGVSDIEDATPVFFYVFNGEEGVWGICSAGDSYGENTWCFNQNGPGAAVLTYFADIDFSRANAKWAFYDVSFETATDKELAMNECLYTYGLYIGLYDSFTTGTTYGCYGEAEVAAFQTALDAVTKMDDPDFDADALTEDDLRAMTQAILDTYEAVIASRISKQMEVAEGYYLFTCGGQTFTETTEEEETPDGEIIAGETIVISKSMYSTISGGDIYAMWKTTERTCPFLWKVTANGDKTYEVMNMATDATFNNVSTSTNVTMSTDSENLMAFDYADTTGDGETLVAIRVSTQAEDGMYYLHCGGHSNGAGVSGNIVGWGSTEPSQWILEPVSEEEAQAMIDAYADTKDATQRYNNAQDMIADAEPKMVIAEDIITGTEALITSVDQLSSPYTEDGSDLAYIIDGDASTFWHSHWTDGNVDAGTHYLQVELNSTYEDLLFVLTRRSDAQNDHITQWGVYGAPNANADKDDCTFLAEISTPLGSADETLTSVAFNTGGFTILRFYIDDTAGSGISSTRGYGHIAEFQLYEAITNETSQKVAMGDVYTNLENAIATAKEEGEDITPDTYTTLKAAYDAFIAMYVDPAELRATLAEAATATEGILIGTNPGEWSDASSANTLNTTLGEATAYDEAGKYTQTQSDTYVETLTSQMAAIMDAANKVETGKWYEIRYATEDEIETNGWSLTPGEGNDANDPLYGKYLCVANLVTEDGVNIVEAVNQSDIEDICLGHNLYFDDKIDMYEEDCAKFRFVSVGDTAYIMQNKATGLFLKAAGTSGAVTLSIHPSLFNVSAIGYGENLISAQTLDGETQNNLHAQLAQNVLVTWTTAEAGTNSGLYIEDINEAVADDYDGTVCNISLMYGAVNTFCFPVEVTTEAGIIYGASVDGTTVTLAPMEDNIAPAGVPFVFIDGNEAALASYDTDDEEEPVPFTHGYDIEKKAKTSGALVGVYESTTPGAGKLVASGNEFVVSKSSSAVSVNSAYINGEYSSDDVIVIEFSDETFDSIEDAIATVAQDGNIYTIDGKLIGKGNLGAVKTLGKGIYIVNGAKVIVK